MADPAQVMRNIAQQTVDNAMGDYPGFLPDNSQNMIAFGGADESGDFVSTDANQQYFAWGISSWVKDAEGEAHVVRE